MTPVAVIRPQPGCDATLTAARALGLEAHGFPLFEVGPMTWEPPPADTFDAILLGSANALRHAGPALAAYAGKPAYAVGETTAQAAQAAGLKVAIVGKGGLEAVIPQLDPAHCRLLRLSGRERTQLVPPPGVSIEERVVYASDPLPLPEGLEGLLGNPALVLLHSAEAARHFAALCSERRIARSRIALAALGPRIAAAAGQGWAALRAAATPDDAALLALAQEMCQERLG